MAWYDFLKADKNAGFGLGNLSTTAKVLGGSLGAMGLAKLVGNSGSMQEFLGMGGANTNQPRGYQGGIPEYTATRTQLPITATQSDGTPRRPGSGGRRYFSDMTYTPTGKVMQGAGLPPPGDRMSDDEAAAFLESLTGLGASGGTSGGTSGGKSGSTPTPAPRLMPAKTMTDEEKTFSRAQPNLPMGSDTKTTSDMARFAKESMTDTPTTFVVDGKSYSDERAIDSGEAASILSMAQNLNQSPQQVADMLGVPVEAVVNRIRADYPHLGANYLAKYNYARGGLASLPRSRGYYLGGPTDGMADKIPARIDGEQEAALSDGEFVIPADIVSHLGNGNSQAGAQVLYQMMDRVRRARTGTTEQGRQINPNKYTPA